MLQIVNEMTAQLMKDAGGFSEGRVVPARAGYC
ncbi:hypothetical protein ROSA5918_25565 [Roseateles saccharophilus]|uniref:Uncharacterized protein n=1 Tax=Roseateles saccharophilus TaxID=304 RepID=A0A4R3UBV0_ROSSA|nr:hypothetical protein EV671_105325 [Roseateles saccharophilus]